MGHIELAAPIVHIWFFKAMPSRLGTLLAMKTSHLERVIYYQDYVVTDPGNTPHLAAPAEVLFDGSEASLANWVHLKPPEKRKHNWKVEEGNLVCVPGAGYLATKEDFGDCQLHIEWMVPAGLRAERSLADTVAQYPGEYICIVEGSIPVAEPAEPLEVLALTVDLGRRVVTAGLAEGVGLHALAVLALDDELVIEFDRPTRKAAKDGAKSDALDAIRAGDMRATALQPAVPTSTPLTTTLAEWLPS